MANDALPTFMKATPQGYHDLRVWRVAVDLAAECYARTAKFPVYERYGMTSQMRRAAVAVVSNIAEGHGRESTGAFANHVSIARGSVKELEAQAILAVRLEFATSSDMEALLGLCSDVSRMLHGLRAMLHGAQAVARGAPSAPDRG